MLDQPRMIRQHADHVARIVVAAVRQVWVDGEWQDITLVLTEAEEDPDAGRLWLASLGPHADTLGARRLARRGGAHVPSARRDVVFRDGDAPRLRPWGGGGGPARRRR